MSGRWHEPSHGIYMRALNARIEIAHVAGLDVSAVLRALDEAGLIVYERYYVPDVDELYGLMQQWSYHMSNGLGINKCRWVMCQETFDALAQQHAGYRVPVPTSISLVHPDDDGAWPGPSSVEAITPAPPNAKGGSLFGIQIRVDPAARSPLFEIDTEATKQPHEVTPS